MDHAYVFVMMAHRLACSARVATELVCEAVSEEDLIEVTNLRNFWEHEAEYPLLESQEVRIGRNTHTLELLASYGRSPGLRQAVRVPPTETSIFISERLNVDDWRAKAQAIAASPPPMMGPSTQAGE